MGNGRVTKRIPRSNGRHTLKVKGGSSFFKFFTPNSTLYKAYKQSLQEVKVDSMTLGQLSKRIDQIKAGDLQKIVISMIHLVLKMDPSVKMDLKSQELESDMDLVRRRMAFLKKEWEIKIKKGEGPWIVNFILQMIDSCTKSMDSSVPQYKVTNVEMAKEKLESKKKELVTTDTERRDDIQQFLGEYNTLRDDVQKSGQRRIKREQILEELGLIKKKYEKGFFDLPHQSTILSNKTREYNEIKNQTTRAGWHNLHRNLMPILQDPLLKSKLDQIERIKQEEFSRYDPDASDKSRKSIESIKEEPTFQPSDKNVELETRKIQLLNESLEIIKKSSMMNEEELLLLSSVSDMESLKNTLRFTVKLQTKMLLLEILFLLGEDLSSYSDYITVPTDSALIEQHLEKLNAWLKDTHRRESFRQIVQQEKTQLTESLPKVRSLEIKKVQYLDQDLIKMKKEKKPNMTANEFKPYNTTYENMKFEKNRVLHNLVEFIFKDDSKFIKLRRSEPDSVLITRQLEIINKWINTPTLYPVDSFRDILQHPEIVDTIQYMLEQEKMRLEEKLNELEINKIKKINEDMIQEKDLTKINEMKLEKNRLLDRILSFIFKDQVKNSDSIDQKMEWVKDKLKKNDKNDTAIQYILEQEKIRLEETKYETESFSSIDKIESIKRNNYKIIDHMKENGKQPTTSRYQDLIDTKKTYLIPMLEYVMKDVFKDLDLDLDLDLMTPDNKVLKMKLKSLNEKLKDKLKDGKHPYSKFQYVLDQGKELVEQLNPGATDS